MFGFKQAESFHKLKGAFFITLIVTLFISVVYIIRPFLYPIFWAAVIAIMFYPIYTWVNKHVKIDSVSASITTILAIVFLLLPLILISVLLINQSAELYQNIAQGNWLNSSLSEVSDRFSENSLIYPYLEKVQETWSEYAASAVQTVSVFIFKNINAVTKNSISFVFMTFLMLYSLFYFLKDGKRFLHNLMHLSPIGNKYETMLYNRFTSTTRATLKSTLIIGGLQGLIGAVLFAITGIDGVIIWGVIMTVLSIIPAVGSVLVWFPAGIIMLAIGNIWQGVTILLVGALVISTIDNILRPPLVGKDIQMHPLLVLFSTLGGLTLFGISGFIIGPILMALFLAVISIYEHFYKKELLDN